MNLLIWMDPNKFCFNIEYGKSNAYYHTIYNLIVQTCKIEFQIKKLTSMAFIY